MLVLLIVLVLHMQLGPAFGAGESGYNALKFGEDTGSYIRFSPEMGPFQNTFSVCSWVRKMRTSGTNAIWFSYINGEIYLGDTGYFHKIFGSHLDLRSKFTSPLGEWTHRCSTWSLQSRTFRVYFNGKLVGTYITPSGRTLKGGGSLVIGNYGGTNEGHFFGGELYRLNIYNKELSSSEVGDMAVGGVCSGVEDLHNNTRQMKWETILGQTRTGNVFEVDTMCNLTKYLRESESLLNQTESRLNATLSELTQKTREMEDTEHRLSTTVEQLNQTEILLDTTAVDLNRTTLELEEATKQLENMTECLQERADLTQWDLLYAEPFFNRVFTRDLYMKLSSSWEIFEDFVGVKITNGVISHFKASHKKETCDPAGEM